MRLKIFIIVLFLKFHTISYSQQLTITSENNWFKNCNCTEISMGNENFTTTYINDTLNKIIIMQYQVFDRASIDTLYYDENENIIQIKNYSIYEDGGKRLTRNSYYSYSEKGKLLTANEGYFVYSYQYDTKGRPLSYTKKYGNTEEVIKVKYTNDTTALLEYYDNGVMRGIGKRILNKRYQIISETIQNPSKGNEVRYAFKYDKKGNLLNMQKVKVIKDEVLFFGSPHYEYLYDTTRKIEYSYDSLGRLITQTTFKGIELKKDLTLQYKYR